MFNKDQQEGQRVPGKRATRLLREDNTNNTNNIFSFEGPKPHSPKARTEQRGCEQGISPPEVNPTTRPHTPPTGNAAGYLRADVLERQAELILVDDVRGDGLRNDLVEDCLSATITPPSGGNCLCLVALSFSRIGRHVAKHGGYARARGDVAANTWGFAVKMCEKKQFRDSAGSIGPITHKRGQKHIRTPCKSGFFQHFVTRQIVPPDNGSQAVGKAHDVRNRYYMSPLQERPAGGFIK